MTHKSQHDKKRKQLLQEKADRQKYAPVTISAKEMKRFSDEHLDLLQNIEFTLVTMYRQDPGIDDLTVLHSLKGYFADQDPSEEKIMKVVEALEDIRKMRADVDEETWSKAIHVIIDSIHNHSSVKPGERGYLKFVSRFII